MNQGSIEKKTEQAGIVEMEIDNRDRFRKMLAEIRMVEKIKWEKSNSIGRKEYWCLKKRNFLTKMANKKLTIFNCYPLKILNEFQLFHETFFMKFSFFILYLIIVFCVTEAKLKF